MKIFHGDKTIHLLNGKPENTGPEDYVAEYRSKKNIRKLLHQLYTKTDITNLIIWHDASLSNAKIIEEKMSLRAVFFSFFKVMDAAGGLVKNEKGEILFIYKRGRWDLPKGKISSVKPRQMPAVNDNPAKAEHGNLKESPEEAAIREVKEETGLIDLRVNRELFSTYHIFLQKGKPILKRTFWFEMFAPSGQVLVPDRKEKIDEVKWIGISEMPEILEKTYPSIRELIS
jgi:8-oxo-dGTP pyrophosphatase MutT (NUDIX family)